jgi:hypothetical protein
MRTLGFRTHVVLVLAGAVGVLVSLSRPWYARAPKPPPPDETLPIGDVNGPLNGFAHGLGRWMSDPMGLSAWHALGVWATVLAALAGIAALCALGSIVPATQSPAREPLRYASLAALALVAWRLVDPPGDNAAWELRHGALIAALGALMLATSAMGVANAPSRRRLPPAAYVAPPAPAHYEAATGGSVPPPR